jgi:hypothetical protein
LTSLKISTIIYSTESSTMCYFPIHTSITNDIKMLKRQGLKEMKKREIALATLQAVSTVVIAFGLPAAIVFANYGF